MYPGLLRARMKVLEDSGQIELTGVTMGRQVHLKGGKPRETEPAPVARRESMEKSQRLAPSTSALDQVLDRDRAVFAKLEDAGRVGRTIQELRISMAGESEVALEQSLTRLKLKKRVTVDEDGRWRAA